jgi:hypothetical protein
MRVIREDRVDAALREALNRTAANTTTATGDNRNLLWGNCIRFIVILRSILVKVSV